jgi:pyruvate ferredoxin oxidoreductase delta subunit
MKGKGDLMDWRELPIGGFILEAGGSAEYETGTWRTMKPVWHRESCISCLTCWAFCPEDAVVLQEGTTPSGKPRREVKEIDLYHCKGCGLCVRECLVNRKGQKVALELVKEQI